MTEVEKHYAGAANQSNGGEGGKHAAGSGPKGTVEDVAGKAKEGFKAASDAARDTYGKASEWGRTRYENASGAIGEAGRRSASRIAERRRGVEDFVEENPVMVGVVGLAAGLLLGALLPGTARENRVFGRYADEVREQGLRYARELAEQGKQYVEENLDTSRARDSDEARPA